MCKQITCPDGYFYCSSGRRDASPKFKPSEDRCIPADWRCDREEPDLEGCVGSERTHQMCKDISKYRVTIEQIRRKK